MSASRIARGAERLLRWSGWPIEKHEVMENRGGLLRTVASGRDPRVACWWRFKGKEENAWRDCSSYCCSDSIFFCKEIQPNPLFLVASEMLGLVGPAVSVSAAVAADAASKPTTIMLHTYIRIVYSIHTQTRTLNDSGPLAVVDFCCNRPSTAVMLSL